MSDGNKCWEKIKPEKEVWAVVWGMLLKRLKRRSF